MFKGVCRVEPEDQAAPDTLSKLTKEQGFHGVRLSPSGNASGDWIKGPLMPPLWKRCADLKVPMTLLVPISRVPELVPLIEKNPHLTVVIDHQADCRRFRSRRASTRCSRSSGTRRCSSRFHTCGTLSRQPYPYPDAQVQVKRLYDKFGAKRLMWGTDWPISIRQLTYAQAVELFRDHMDFVTPADHEWILGKTVQQVWPFGL